MRRIVLAFCSVCMVAASPLGGEQQAPPSFKGGVTLVTIDVTVLDRDGRPVPGLTAADFQVKLNGRVQPVRALSYLEARADATRSEPQPAAPVMPQLFPVAPVAGEVAAAVTEPRVFVILVDDLSFPPLGGKALFLAAQRFIATLPAADLVGFATSSGPGSVNPTADRAHVGEALSKVVGEYLDPRGIDRGGPLGTKTKNDSPDQSLGISQALDIDRGDITALKEAIVRECFGGDPTIPNRQSVEQILISNKCASDLQVQARRTAGLTRQTTERQVGALKSVITAMKPATGVKHVVLLTDGVGVTFDATTLTPVVRAAAEASVQLSVMVEEPGLSMTDTGRRDPGAGVATQADTGMSQRRREDNAMFVNGAHTLADMVGGAFYRVVGAPDLFFRRVTVATSGVYRLAVEPPGDTAPGRDFALIATVRRQGLTVQANKRAIASAPAVAGASSSSVAATTAAAPKPAGSVDDRLRAAMNAGRAINGLPIGIVSSIRRAADPSQVEVGVRVEIPSAAEGPLTAIFGVVDSAGTLRSGRRPIDTPPDGESYRLTFSVPVVPGAYRLRFAVADATGRVSAADTPVRAELTAMGPFTAGDLQTSWLAGVGAPGSEPSSQFPPDDLPASATTLNASLDLYLTGGATIPRDVLVKLTFGLSGQPGIERIVAPANDSGTFRADAQFPLDRVAAGAYSLQATVLVDGSVVGTTSATIRRR
jgi:VWFA-related protein